MVSWGWVGWGGVVLFTACVNLMYVRRPAVMVSAILTARHRTFAGLLGLGLEAKFSGLGLGLGL